ncbi:MAG TPA: malto-oligosyltrehalose trehalohydrolase [Candidatus Sulfotelmatobacter sp.]|nr:malto-oligosyltrehalose trehalohydrolase [Candidatus Sulfotelmatobacter sp.]
MKKFAVWAPLPHKVEIQFDGKLLPMRRAGGGWWTAEVSEAKPGDRYGFVLDGAGPFPDPRSASQPDGVHKLSQVVNENAFYWTDRNFQAPPLASAIIYELHIGTFTLQGTFLAAIERLDHLVALGVTHVELMPVVEFSGDHGWGYDGVDLFAPHHAYGSPDDLKKLVAACHARGLAVILDVVYNHLGPSGNYLAKYGPYFTKKFASPWGEGINFDGPDSGEVRRFFCDNALMWLRDFHFDALRLDAIHGILDTSAIHILEQLELEMERLSAQLGRHLALIPESDLNDPRLLWPRERGGFQLAAQWSDDFHHTLHTVLTGQRTGYYSDYGTLAALAKALRHAFVYDGVFSEHRRRVHGRSTDGLSGHRFLGYLQNHDQVGNRARGERSSHLMSLGKLKIGAALVLASPFLPMLFQGEEWGASTPFFYFTDYQEPELANAVREGRCREFAAFGWKPEDTADPQARETFEQSKLKWDEVSKSPHADILDWHKRLIQLRRAEADLSDGELTNVQVTFDEKERWLVMKRGRVSVVCNLSERPQRIPIGNGTWKILMTLEEKVRLTDGFAEMPPESVSILRSSVA